MIPTYDETNKLHVYKVPSTGQFFVPVWVKDETGASTVKQNLSYSSSESIKAARQQVKNGGIPMKVTSNLPPGATLAGTVPKTAPIGPFGIWPWPILSKILGGR